MEENNQEIQQRTYCSNPKEFNTAVIGEKIFEITNEEGKTLLIEKTICKMKYMESKNKKVYEIYLIGNLIEKWNCTECSKEYIFQENDNIEELICEECNKTINDEKNDNSNKEEIEQEIKNEYIIKMEKIIEEEIKKDLIKQIQEKMKKIEENKDNIPIIRGSGRK